MKRCPLVEDLLRPVLRVAMQRAVGSADVPDSVSPPARETKNCPCAFTNSST